MDDSELYYGYSKNSLLLMEYMLAHIKPEGMCDDGFKTMCILRDEGPVSMGVLAERLDILPARMTRIADMLESSGFVRRSEDENDRRSMCLGLTEDGIAASTGFLRGQRLIYLYCTKDLDSRDIVALDAINRKIADRIPVDAGPGIDEDPDPVCRLYDCCYRNGTEMRRVISRTVKPNYISRGEYGLLGAARILGRQPLSVLAKRLLMVNSNLTYILNGLVSKGYAVKVRSDEDRRRFYVDLTDSGKELADRLIEGRDRMARLFLSGLDETDRRHLEEIILKIKACIDELEDVRPETMTEEGIASMGISGPPRVASYELRL